MFREELLQIISTISDPKKAFENIFLNEWINRHEMICQDDIVEINELYNNQVERFYPTGIIDPAEIQNFHEKLKCLHSKLNRVKKIIATMLSASNSEQNFELNSIESENSINGLPRVLQLLNGIQIELVSTQLNNAESSEYYHCRYENEAGIAHIRKVLPDNFIIELSRMSVYSRFAQNNPDIALPLMSSGIFVKNEDVYFVDIFTDGVLFSEIQPTKKDIDTCAKLLDRINHLGCLHLQSNKMLFVRSNGKWMVIELGAQMINSNRDYLDAVHFCLSQGLTAAQIKYPLKINPSTNFGPFKDIIETIKL